MSQISAAVKITQELSIHTVELYHGELAASEKEENEHLGTNEYSWNQIQTHKTFWLTPLFFWPVFQGCLKYTAKALWESFLFSTSSGSPAVPQ